MLSRIATVLVVGLALAITPAPAHAGIICVSMGPGGVCLLIVASPDEPTMSGGSGSGTATVCTTLRGAAVPCSLTDGAWWSRANACYLRLANPQPSPDQLDQWGKPMGLHPGEKAFLCISSPSGGSGGSYPIVWLPVAPAVDPATLARQAITQMNLSAITVGIVPDPLPGRIGIIGMPTWLWADAPTESTVGPITRTAAAAGNAVTATATVKRIVWNMGDGSSVTCTGPGTRYEDRYGKSSSPTCGYTYTRQGVYTVTATSYWDVAWTGMGQSGVIPLNFSRSVSITMGEIQVVSR